jgi:hypothetical protein
MITGGEVKNILHIWLEIALLWLINENKQRVRSSIVLIDLYVIIAWL